MGVSNQQAAAVLFTPAGGIAAGTVQAALEELDNEKGGLTLLASGNLSGASVNITGLELTGYKALLLLVNNASGGGSGNITVDGQAAFAPGAAGNSAWGWCLIDLTTSVFASFFGAAATSAGATAGVGGAYGGKCGLTTASVALALSGVTFDAGSYRLYGVK